jgi:hypothetical protein
LKNIQNDMKFYHDRIGKERKMFDNRELVRYRDNLSDKLWKEGQILKPVNSRSYELVNAKGNIIRRNSCLLIADRTKQSLSADSPDYSFQASSRTGTLPGPQPAQPTPFVSPSPHPDLHRTANHSNSGVASSSRNSNNAPIRVSERIAARKAAISEVPLNVRRSERLKMLSEKVNK